MKNKPSTIEQDWVNIRYRIKNGKLEICGNGILELSEYLKSQRIKLIDEIVGIFETCDSEIVYETDDHDCVGHKWINSEEFIDKIKSLGEK